MIYKAIIFDLDGTLVDSYPGILESLNYVLNKLNRQTVNLAQVKKMVGRGIENLMRQAVGEDHIHEGIALFRQNYDHSHLSGTFLMPGVLETLPNLYERFPLAVASNKPPDYTQSILKRLQIDHFFSQYSGPGGEMQPKPDPSMLSTLMDKFRVTAAETLYVGDMPLDAETARNAGVRVALIPGGGGTFEELKAANPDYLLERFSDLPGVLAV